MLGDSQHSAKHAQQANSTHKPIRSPLEANLQPLIPSPVLVYGQTPRPTEQQQQQLRQQPCSHKRRGEQQGRQALQQPWLQQEQTQRGMLPNKQLHDGTASSVRMTGPKPPASLTPDADLIDSWAAPGKCIQGTASCRAGTNAADLQQTDLMADKENAQPPGRKGPVRKALFGGQGKIFTGSQATASAGCSEPACQHVGGTVDGLDAVGRHTEAATPGRQEPAEPAVQKRGENTVDFASVFDFL